MEVVDILDLMPAGTGDIKITLGDQVRSVMALEEIVYGQSRPWRSRGPRR